MQKYLDNNKNAVERVRNHCIQKKEKYEAIRN